MMGTNNLEDNKIYNGGTLDDLRGPATGENAHMDFRSEQYQDRQLQDGRRTSGNHIDFTNSPFEIGVKVCDFENF